MNPITSICSILPLFMIGGSHSLGKNHSLTVALIHQGATSLAEESIAASRQNGAFICKVNDSTDFDKQFETLPALKSGLRLSGPFSDNGFAGFMWDCSSLYPAFAPDPNELTSQKMASALAAALKNLTPTQSGQLFQKAGNPEATGGVSANQIGAGPAEILAGLMPGGDTSVLGDPGARFDVVSSAGVQFVNSQGKTVNLAFRIGKDSKPILKDFFTMMSRPAPRVPPELRKLLVATKEAPSGGRIFVTVANFVKDFVSGPNVNLVIDKRVLDYKIALVLPAGFRASSGDYAEALAAALGMYWRPVGTDFFLAISPGHPIQMMGEVEAKKTKQASAPLIRALQANGLLPQGLELSDLVNLNRSVTIPSEMAQELADALEFSSPEDKASFLTEFANAGQGGGPKASIYLNASVDLTVPSRNLNLGTELGLGN